MAGARGWGGRLATSRRPRRPANPALTPHAPGLDTRSACPRECEQPQRLVHQRLAQRPTPGAARLRLMLGSGLLADAQALEDGFHRVVYVQGATQSPDPPAAGATEASSGRGLWRS